MFGKIGSTLGVAGSKGKFLCTLKAAAISPAFAVVLLGGIVGWQIWKGKKDAPKTKEATTET